jgi:hypothetical protein
MKLNRVMQSEKSSSHISVCNFSVGNSVQCD